MKDVQLGHSRNNESAIPKKVYFIEIGGGQKVAFEEMKSKIHPILKTSVLSTILPGRFSFLSLFFIFRTCPCPLY